MKKAKLLLPLFAVMALTGCSGASLAKTAPQRRVQTRTETALEHYIPTYVDGNLNVIEGSQDCGGKEASPEGTFWTHRNFNALDNFYSGVEREGWTGKLQTKTWLQKTRYISFLVAGMRNTETMYIEVYVNDVKVDTITNKYFNNPWVSVNMVLMPYELPSTIVTDDQLTNGVNMKLVLVDGETGDYGFINFGSLMVNQTVEDIARTLSIHENSLSNYNPDTLTSNDAERDSLARTHQLDLYNTHADFAPFRAVNLTDADNDFEDEYGINRLAFDRSYLAGSGQTLMYNKAISDWENSEPADHHIPYNKNGSKFFKGFYEGNGGTHPHSGFVASDNYKYRFLTNSFTLSGTGIVSVKMGGRPASVHVLNGDPTSGNYLQELAFIDCKTYVDANLSNIALNDNGSPTTMIRHIINLEAFLGQKICLGLADVDTNGGWGAVNFDEIKTYYADYPTFKVDVVEQHNNIVANSYIALFDRYVSSTSEIIYVNGATAPEVDTAPNNKAYAFLKDYYNTFRAKNSGQTYCGSENLNANAATLKSDYEKLTTTEKAIVDGSEDFHRSGIAVASNVEDFYTHEIVKANTVGQSIAYICGRYATSSSSGLFAINFSATNEQTTVFVAIMSTVLLVTAICFFVVIRNSKKEKNN